MLIRRLLLIFVFTLLITNLSTANTLPETMVKKLKSATVFVNSSSGSGSGFLFRKDDKTGYITTNAHVVGKAENVEITFNSGENGEFSTDGIVVALDPKLDLAIIRINTSDLPAPIPILEHENQLKKKMPVYALGFPLGKFFSDAPGKNPSVTITQGVLKDLLKNDNRVLSDIQFNADINHGNSGGPVVNQEGQVIAVAYSGYEHTQVEFGIPAPRLNEFIRGGIKDFSIKIKRNKPDLALLDAEASINDPFNNISSLRLFIIPKSKLTGKSISSVPGTGYYVPVIRNYNRYKTLKRNAGKFRQEFSMKVPPGKDIICYYQLMIVKKNKQVVFTEPKEFYIMSVSAKGSEASSTSYSAIQRTFISAGLKIQQFILKLQRPEAMILDRNGKYLFLLCQGIIYKVSTSSLTVDKVYSTTHYCRDIAISKYGLLVAVWDRNKNRRGIMVLNEDNLSLRAWIPVPARDVFHISANPRLRYAYVIGHNGDEMFIMDSKLKQISEKIDPRNDLKVDNLSTTAIAPAGKYFYCKASKTFYKFKIYGPKLILTENSTGMLENGRIVVSPDGKYIAISGTKAIVYRTNDLKKIISLPVETPNQFPGFAFDTRRKRFYYGNRIYTSNGVFIKKIPGVKTHVNVLFNGNNKLFLKDVSSLVCVDLGFDPEQEKKTEINDIEDDGGWLGNEDNGNSTAPKKSAEIRSLAKAKIKVEDITITEIDLNANNIAGKFCWSRDGKSFFAAEKNGIVRKITFPGLIEKYRIDLKSEIKGIQLCKSGAVVLAPKEQLIYLLNEKKLSTIKKIVAPGIWKFAASPSLDIIYGINDNDKMLYFISVNRGGIIKSLKGLKETGKKSKLLDSYNIFYFDNCHVSNDGKYLLCENDVPPELARFRILNKGLELKYEEEQSKLLDPASFFNFSMESNLITEYPRSYPDGTKPVIKAFNIKELSSLIMKTDVLLLGLDAKMRKFYGLDKKMNLKVFTAQGKVIKIYPTNLQHAYQGYNYQGQILVHPDGAKFIALTRGKIFKAELPEFPANMPVKIAGKPDKTTSVRERAFELAIPKAVFNNKKISCVTGSSQGVSRSYLKLEEEYANIRNCVWEPGTNNILIAWNKGKISKIDVEKMIEICTLSLPLKSDRIGNIAMSKAGLIVNLRFSKKVLVFSPKDLSFIDRLKFDCNRVLALPNLDLIVMHKGSDLLLYDFNKKEIVGKCPGVDPIFSVITLSPDGKKIYIKDNNSLTIYSLTEKGFELIKKFKLPEIFSSAKKITISSDGKYLTLLPQSRSQSRYPNATYIYSPDNFKKPVASINTGSPIYTIGFDTIAGIWYYHAPDKYKNKLMMKRGEDIYESLPIGFFRRIYVHPEGGKFLLQDNNDVFFVKIDLSHKNFIKGDK